MSEHEKAQKVAMRTDELARLRGENERLKRSFSPRYDDRRDIAAVIEHLRFGDSDGDDHDAAATEIERLQSELTALRRPVVQSDEVERIRFAKVTTLDDIETLLHSLDAAQREIQQLQSQAKPRKCAATLSTDPPMDCDAPFCGCNPEWSKCIGWLQESGWLSTREVEKLRAGLTASQQHTAGSGDAVHSRIGTGGQERCSDCPPANYPTDKTRCALCDRRSKPAHPIDPIDPRPTGRYGIDQGQFLAACGGGNAAFGERNSGGTPE